MISGLLYVGMGASIVAFLSWNIGVQCVGVSRGVIFLNLIPAIPAAIAVPVLGESLVLTKLLGGFLVFAGVAIVSRSGDGKALVKPPPAGIPPG